MAKIPTTKQLMALGLYVPHYGDITISFADGQVSVLSTRETIKP
jgi:hypothetical protein